MKHPDRRMKPFLPIFENILKSNRRSMLASKQPESRQDHRGDQLRTGNAMLAEKYILLLETLRSIAERGPAYPDGAPKVISTSPHVPIKQPGAGNP